jgi:hypothetical protein
MPDRSTIFVDTVAVLLAIAGLGFLLRTALRRFPRRVRGFRGTDVSRWRRLGWSALAPLLPALLAVFALCAAGSMLSDQRLIANQSGRGFRAAPQLDERLATAFDPARIARSLLEGSRYLRPPGPWAVALLPLLAVSAIRRKFPFSRGRGLAILWTSIGFLGVASWAIERWQVFHWSFSQPSTLLFALVAPLTLSIPMLGHPFFLTTFLANADDRTERHLSRAPSAPRIVVTRLIFLGIALFVFTRRFPFDFERFWSAWISLSSRSHGSLPVAEWTWTVLASAVATFVAVAIPFACLEASTEGFLRRTLGWWRRDGLFLASLALASGAAGWLLSLPLEILVPISWGDEAGSRALIAISVRSLGAWAVWFGVNLLAFSMLLGNWLEARDALGAQAEAPPEEVPVLP